MRTHETQETLYLLSETRHAIGRQRKKALALRRQCADRMELTKDPEVRRDLSRTWGELYETTEALYDTMKALDAQRELLRKDKEA